MTLRTGTASATAATYPSFVFGALRSGTAMFRPMPNAHHAPGDTQILFGQTRLDPAHPAGRHDPEAPGELRLPPRPDVNLRDWAAPAPGCQELPVPELAAPRRTAAPCHA